MFIYLITNKINGKRYIGQTSAPIERRWSQHRSEAKTGSNTRLYNAIRKYGEDNFEIEPLAIVRIREEINLYEKYLISLFDLRNPDNGYNIAEGGDGIGSGYIHDDESRRKNSEAHKGFVVPLERRIKISKSMKGKPKTEETRLKFSLRMLGTKVSEETKQKIRDSLIGTRLSEETRQKMKISQQARRLKESNE